MRVTVRLFAALRDAAKRDALILELSANATVSDAIATLHRAEPSLSPFLSSTATAVNREYVFRDHVLTDGDELALIPPVSGG